MASSKETPPSEAPPSTLTPKLERQLREDVLDRIERQVQEFTGCIDQKFEARLKEIQAKYRLPDDFIKDAALARLTVQAEQLVVEHQLTTPGGDPASVQLHDFDEILPQIIRERAEKAGMNYTLPPEAIRDVGRAYSDTERMYDSGLCEPEHGLPEGPGRKDPSMKMPG